MNRKVLKNVPFISIKNLSPLFNENNMDNNWRCYANFKILMDEFDEFFCALCEIFRYILLRRIEIDVILSTVLTEVQNNLVELKKKNENAQKCLDASQNISLDRNFSILFTLSCSFRNNVLKSKRLISSFIDGSKEIPRQMNEFVLNMTEINNGLIKVLESTAWNEILEIEIRSYASLSPKIGRDRYLAFMHYLEFGKDFDLSDELFGEIEEKIMDPVKNLFINGSFMKPDEAGHYSAIIGPSFMGKTQFSFILAKKYPVIYLNLILSEHRAQEIYKCFDCFRKEVDIILAFDEQLLYETQQQFKYQLDPREPISKAQKIYCDWPFNSSNFIFANPDLKLKVIGFLWNLVEYSTTFDFNNSTDESWFSHYLKDRVINYAIMSLNMFWDKMKRLVEKTPNFRIPIIFIDELPRGSSDNVKLLRNVVRCLILPCVLSSTNASISNMLNLTSGSSLSDENQVWVNGICKIMKANLVPIFNRLEVTPGKFLKQFTCDDHLSLDPKILADLKITCDDENKKNLFKIWDFILQQSSTCLQGTCYYAFRLFIIILTSFKGRRLDSAEFWSKLCLEIAKKFKSRKPNAFQLVGQQLSCQMFSTNAKISDNDSLKDRSQLIYDSIDSHFYYVGEENGPNVLPFSFEDKNLIIDNEPYRLCSHFKKFKKDVFTNMALWFKTVGENETIALVSQKYDYIHTKTANPNARINDFRAQETMCYWALAYVSHQNFNGKTFGTDFFCNFVKNVQIPPFRNIMNITLNAARIPLSLRAFLNDITVPYLIPDNPTNDFKSSLAGLCDLGLCYRCPNREGMDISYDVFYKNQPCSAYVECKYQNVPQDREDVTVYITKAKVKNSVLNFYVSYKLARNLTEAGMDQTPRALRAHTIGSNPNFSTWKKFGMNIYSVFYEEDVLKVETLSEIENPSGVFIVVESNFEVEPN